jgi:pimeloyl-ACP methyl ester carboxylesterase
MRPLLPKLAPTRRRFLGSAAMAMFAARLGLTGSARAQIAKESTMTTADTPRYAAQDAISTDIRPFQVEVPQADLDDLRQRLAAARWPSQELVADRSQGVQLATMQELTRYWATDYDWRKVEAALNALPQFTTEIDGVDIHFIHVESPHEDALPLIMTHGWPGSVIELLETIGPLTDPTAHGGDADDAFHLVLPSLPGYGFSAQPAELGWESGRIALAWAELMNRLGYDRYVAQGGDVGALVTDVMGRQAPEGLLGIHLNLLAGAPFIVDQLPAESEEERAAHEALATFTMDGFGYFLEQSTRPQTIGYALLDSPVALAAWMLDHDTDSYYKMAGAFVDGQPTGGLTRESIVDNITLYWLTGTGASAARWYWETGRAVAAARAAGEAPPAVSVPVGFTTFPGEIFPAPRSWVETAYPGLAYFNEVDKGGHFAAWEEPQLFSEEVRAAFRSLR